MMPAWKLWFASPKDIAEAMKILRRRVKGRRSVVQVFVLLFRLSLPRHLAALLPCCLAASRNCLAKAQG